MSPPLAAGVCEDAQYVSRLTGADSISASRVARLLAAAFSRLRNSAETRQRVTPAMLCARAIPGKLPTRLGRTR